SNTNDFCKQADQWSSKYVNLSATGKGGLMDRRVRSITGTEGMLEAKAKRGTVAIVPWKGHTAQRKCFLSGQDFDTTEKAIECSEVQEGTQTQSQQPPRVKLNGSTRVLEQRRLEQHREQELALRPPLELETELRKRQQILLEAPTSATQPCSFPFPSPPPALLSHCWAQQTTTPPRLELDPAHPEVSAVIEPT
ncbi:unnamed protein product, partial [Coregonus sp. 'balchen']